MPLLESEINRMNSIALQVPFTCSSNKYKFVEAPGECSDHGGEEYGIDKSMVLIRQECSL